MRLNKVQVGGLILLGVTLLSMALTGTAHAAIVDSDVRIALYFTPTAPRAFTRCVMHGERVYIPGTFIGRQCVSRDGERWFAGFAWKRDSKGRVYTQFVTGP